MQARKDSGSSDTADEENRKSRAKSNANTFDLEAGVKDQVYAGVSKEDWKGSELVRETEGMVLTSKVILHYTDSVE